MKKSELLAKIEALEDRIRSLEARPIYYPPHEMVPWSPIVTCAIVTCAVNASVLPGQCSDGLAWS